jgi:hypothetical protein
MLFWILLKENLNNLIWQKISQQNFPLFQNDQPDQQRKNNIEKNIFYLKKWKNNQINNIIKMKLFYQI